LIIAYIVLEIMNGVLKNVQDVPYGFGL